MRRTGTIALSFCVCVLAASAQAQPSKSGVDLALEGHCTQAMPLLDAGMLGVPGGLARLTAESPSVQSLLQLALGAEYAETRWRGGRGRT